MVKHEDRFLLFSYKSRSIFLFFMMTFFLLFNMKTFFLVSVTFLAPVLPKKCNLVRGLKLLATLVLELHINFAKSWVKDDQVFGHGSVHKPAIIVSVNEVLDEITLTLLNHP